MELSPYNVRESGMGHAGMASVRKLGSSITNPSKTGFNTKTTFEAILETDMVHLDDGKSTNTAMSSRIPFLGLNFQAGRFGNLGIHYYQRFEKDFEILNAKDGFYKFNAGS